MTQFDDIYADGSVVSYEPVQLADNGSALLNVVVGSDPDAEVDEMANELVDYLNQITGATFTKTTGDGSAGIVVGTITDFPSLQYDENFDVDDRMRGNEHLIISRLGVVHIIGGTRRGASLGVWSFLHKIGFRHYFPMKEWEIVPNIPDLTVEMSHFESPSYIARSAPHPTSWTDSDLWLKWRWHNRKVSGFYISNSHNYGNIYNARKSVFDDNPEWMSPDAPTDGFGNRKFNVRFEGVVDTIVDYAVSLFVSDPSRGSVSMDPSDGGGWSMDQDEINYDPVTHGRGWITVDNAVNSNANGTYEKDEGTGFLTNENNWYFEYDNDTWLLKDNNGTVQATCEPGERIHASSWTGNEAEISVNSEYKDYNGGHITDRVILIANEVAKAINALGFGDKYVGIQAYNDNSPPPNINVHPRVGAFIATAFLRDGWRFNTLVPAWAEKGAIIGERGYYDTFAWHQGLGRSGHGGNIYLRESRIPQNYNNGIRLIRSTSTDAWPFNGVGFYVSAEYLWNVNAPPVTELYDKFLEDCYGPAKADMKVFHDMFVGGDLPRSNTDILARSYDALAAAYHTSVRGATDEFANGWYLEDTETGLLTNRYGWYFNYVDNVWTLYDGEGVIQAEASSSSDGDSSSPSTVSTWLNTESGITVKAPLTDPDIIARIDHVAQYVRYRDLFQNLPTNTEGAHALRVFTYRMMGSQLSPVNQLDRFMARSTSPWGVNAPYSYSQNVGPENLVEAPPWRSSQEITSEEVQTFVLEGVENFEPDVFDFDLVLYDYETLVPVKDYLDVSELTTMTTRLDLSFFRSSQRIYCWLEEGQELNIKAFGGQRYKDRGNLIFTLSSPLDVLVGTVDENYDVPPVEVWYHEITVAGATNSDANGTYKMNQIFSGSSDYEMLNWNFEEGEPLNGWNMQLIEESELYYWVLYDESSTEQARSNPGSSSLKPWEVTGWDGILDGITPSVKEGITMTSPFTGIHELLFRDGNGRSYVEISEDVLHSFNYDLLYTTDLASQSWEFYFFVPTGLKLIGMTPSFEHSRIEIYDSNNNEITGWESSGLIEIPVPPGQDGKIWRFRKTSNAPESYVRLMSLPGYVARSPEELLLPLEVIEAELVGTADFSLQSNVIATGTNNVAYSNEVNDTAGEGGVGGGEQITLTLIEATSSHVSIDISTSVPDAYNRMFRSEIQGNLGTVIAEDVDHRDPFVDNNIEPGKTYYYTLVGTG